RGKGWKKWPNHSNPIEDSATARAIALAWPVNMAATARIDVVHQTVMSGTARIPQNGGSANNPCVQQPHKTGTAMEYRTLGRSGLKVSVFSFGTMTFGGAGMFAGTGSTQVDDARRQIDLCIEAGVNLFDTANMYSAGLS